MSSKNNDKPMILHKHNLMVKAKYNLTTLETKLYLNILYFLQGKINDRAYDLVETNNNIISLKMNKSLFKELVPGKQYLEDAKFIRIFEGLRTKPIYYKIDKKWTLSGFIDRATIDEDDPSIIKIELDIFTAKMLAEYKDNGYTPLNLALMFGLEGMYSYRLYELIRLWSNSKDVINYTVDELKEYLMLEDKKSYNTYANFKNKVIKPAVDELNNLGLFNIEYTENKNGRKVNSLDFKVKDLDKRKYFDNKKEMKVIEYGNKEKNDTVEPLEVVIDTNRPKKEIDVVKKEINVFYVPDESLFTKGTLVLFKRNFKEYDFTKEELEDIFFEAYAVTVDRDNIDIIGNSSYKFFRQTLENKLNDYFGKEPKKVNSKSETLYKKTKFHNFTETFDQYTEDELDKIIERSQKEKFR